MGVIYEELSGGVGGVGDICGVDCGDCVGHQGDLIRSLRAGLLEIREMLRMPTVLEEKQRKMRERNAKAGRVGGLAMTEEQQRTRKRNMLVALSRRWPSSVRIQQELRKYEKPDSGVGG